MPEESEQDIEGLLKETMIENFPYLVKEIDLQVQEAYRTPNKRNPRRDTPRNIIIKMPRAAEAGLAQWKSVGLGTERSRVRFQSRACTLVAGTSPVVGVQEAAGRCFSLIDVSNSLSLSIPLSVKSIKYILKKKEKEKGFDNSYI